MVLTPGTRLGPYEVTEQIGVGGMGEVYRATDTNLKRAVAIKVLPGALAVDVERLARFQREAEVLATLNHPHIAAIYGLERSGGITGLVMELVEGPTLAERVAQGAIPVDEALPIAKQIAEALEAAHEQGIVHRDLKPANIKVRPDGTVKVLDFGLAKAMEPAGTSSGASQAPTITTPAMTQAGMMLGTAAYMAPEQARGKPVDRRADIWAFGCVLFEMLAGKQTFTAGETISDAVAAILKNDPEWSALPKDTPDQIRTLLRRCLQKDVQKRLPHIGVARMEIEETLAGVVGLADPTWRMSLRRERLAWVAVVAIAALAAGALALTLRPVSALLETRVDISALSTTDLFSFAIAPDGRRVVFAASEDGRQQLWLRSLDNETSLPVQGTEGAALPFWSPDSRSIAFFANGALKRVELSGGQPQTLSTASNPRGGTWGEEGVILFSSLSTGPILRVPATGGEIAEATMLATGQFGHRFPEFLPGSRQFLFHASGIQGSSGIYLGSLDGSEVARLTEADTVGRYAPPGWLLFIRQGTLVAQHFDRSRGVLTGDPARVAEDIAVNVDQSNGAFSASAAGPLVLRAGESSPRQLTWFDRGGKTLGVMGATDGTQADVALAPDGRRVAVQRTIRGNGDIWLIDAARTTRFTFAENLELFPLWSPDGSRLAFTRNQGTLDLFEKSSSGAGTEQLLLKSGTPLDWSPDGRFLLYAFIAGVIGAGQDQWVLPMDGDRKPFAFSNTPFNERLGQFSPDGRWVAYQSDESGRQEIYVRPFPGPGGQWQVSAAGGITPRWRADGRELFYIAPDSTLMAAPVVVNDTAVEPGVPVALFRPRIVGGGTNPIGTRWQYDVAPDGRFLINVETEEARVSPITLILNWNPRGRSSPRVED